MPRIVEQPAPDEAVQLLVSERVAREIETQFFKPSGLRLSPPHLFTEHGDTVVTYIVALDAG